MRCVFHQTVCGALALSFSACSVGSSSSSSAAVVTSCLIPTDQSGTISGRWPVTPIPVALHQGDFGSTETASIVSAATTWNTFFTKSKNITTIIDAGGGTRFSSNTNPSQTGNLCANGLVPGTSFVGNVVVYKASTWPAAYSQSAIAITSFCVLPATPYSRMFMAVMEVNYQNFFSSGLKQPDMESIMLHEFGHLLGLNHSCENTTKANTPNCSDSSLNPDYSVASMFPIFNFDATGAGQVKKTLGKNDQSRANCLYP